MNGILIHKIGKLGEGYAFFPLSKEDAEEKANTYLQEHALDDLQASVVSITPPKENTDE